MITLFGCTHTTLHVAKFLNNFNLKINLITISPSTAKSNEVAGFIDLTLYKKYFSSIYVAKNYSLKSEKDEKKLKSYFKSDLGFCIGWQRLIPLKILTTFSKGIYGMHGSSRNLPFGKGRSPMNWAIIEGRKWFHTNLFRYQDGIDNGPIVDTLAFSINNSDSIETLQYKNVISMCQLLEKNLNNLLNGTIQTKKQNNKNESFYLKRNKKDGLIDWRDDIFNIDRLIRAVSHPFYGAFTFYKKSELKIYRANIFYTDIESHPYIKAKFGQLLEVFLNKKFLVRCSGGVLLVHEYSGNLPPKNIVFKSKNSPSSKVSRNKYGFFDVEK